MARHFKDLIAWQKAMDLVTRVYELTENFPQREIYGLTNQLRRAAVSVPSIIAEGQAHHSKKEFLHFLQHARGSVAEIETQILLAQRLRYLENDDATAVLQELDELGRILSGLVASLRS